MDTTRIIKSLCLSSSIGNLVAMKGNGTKKPPPPFSLRFVEAHHPQLAPAAIILAAARVCFSLQSTSLYHDLLDA